jgi:hypothetical protein
VLFLDPHPKYLTTKYRQLQNLFPGSIKWSKKARLDIQTPEVFRSEDEQLVGHEFIEVLSMLKLSKVPPLSP